MNQLETALKEFSLHIEGLKEKFDILKDVVKLNGMERVNELIIQNQFQGAMDMVKQLDEINKVELSTNAVKIYGILESTFKEKKEEIVQKEKPPVEGSAAITLEEKEVIKLIGIYGASRINDFDVAIHENILEKLTEKKLLHMEKIFYAGKPVLVFELSTRGKKEFEIGAQTKPTLSAIQTLKKKYASTNKINFFLHEAEKRLLEKGYQINSISESVIECCDLEDNNYYFIPDTGDFVAADYLRLMDEFNEKKSIGFICADAFTMELCKENVTEWMNKNENKCQLLQVYVTHVEKVVLDITDSFESISRTSLIVR
jgi:hypothetical protein